MTEYELVETLRHLAEKISWEGERHPYRYDDTESVEWNREMEAQQRGWENACADNAAKIDALLAEFDEVENE